MSPRPLLQSATLAVAAAIAGYFLGKSDNDENSATTRQSLVERSDAPGGRSGGRIIALQATAASARTAPASQSEQAWVKWAFAVTDKDIPDAIAGLNPRTDFHALRVLFSRWVKLDPQAAWKAFDALDIPPKSLRWYEGSSETGLGMSTSRMQNEPRSLILGRMLWSWHSMDPAAAVAYAQKLEAARKSDGNGASFSMAGYEITRFLKDHATASPTANSPVGNPGAAQDWSAAMISAVEKTEDNRDGTRAWAAMSKWAAADPEAAAWWLMTKPAGIQPASAANYLQMLSKAPPAVKMQLLLSTLTESGKLEKAQALFGQVPKGEEGMHPESYTELKQLRFGSDSLRDWMSSSPAEAKTWLASQPDSPLKSLLYGQAAGVLSQTSPQEAIALLDGVSDADLPAAVAGLASGWAAKDAEACADWIAKIGDVATRDASQAALSRQIMTADPAMALHLTLGITDTEVRDKLQKDITQGLRWNPSSLRQILSSDPAFAQLRDTVDKMLAW